MNNEPRKISLTAKTDFATMNWESPEWDAGIDDWCHAFFSLMVGVTFSPETVLRGMKEFAENNLPDERFEDE